MSRDPANETNMIHGQHRLLPKVYHGRDISVFCRRLVSRISADPNDAAAMVDMATVLQSQGQTDQALAVLAEALKIRRSYCVEHGDGGGLRILALVTIGDFMANTPLDFLLQGSNCRLWLHYVDAETISLADAPDHDLVFIAVGEASHHVAVLQRIASLLAAHDKPVMNDDPHLLMRLTRDGVSRMFANQPALVVPATQRLDRAGVEAAIRCEEGSANGLPAFPFVIRPVGTHAGKGMARVGSIADLADYLRAATADFFYLSPFHDYRGPDGLFSKQRIVFIQGHAYPSHLALSDHWMVHYLNGGMSESPEKRAVEAAWIEDFDTDFAMRHGEAFSVLCDGIGLDYFGIDCAELPDGRLLVFELDTAMVVHNMDDPALFPYKTAPMQRLFGAFVAAAQSIADGTA